MNRLRFFRKFALFLATLAAVAAVLLFTLDLGFLRGSIEKQVQQVTGREFSIRKGLSISFGRELVIRARDVHLGNPEWAGEGSLVNAFNVHAVVDTWSLWKGPVVIRHLEVDDLTVSLQQNKDGLANWEFADTTEAPESGKLPLLAESIVIRDAYIEFFGPRLDQPIVAVIDLFEEQVEPDGKIQINLTGTLNDRPMQVGVSGSPYDRLRSGEDFSIDGSGSFGNISIAGKASFDNLWRPLQPKTEIQFSGPEFKELTDMLGIEGLGGGELSMSASSTVDNGQTLVRMNGNLGDIDLDINATMPSLAEAAGASVQARVGGPNFGRIARLAGSEGWPEEAFEIDTRFLRPDEALDIQQFHLLLAGTSIDLEGLIPAFPDMSGSALTLRIEGPDLAPFVTVTGLQNIPDGAFSLAGDVNTSPEGMTRLDVQYEVPLASGGIKGNIGSGEGMTGSAFRMTASGGDASALGEMLDLSGLPAEPWTVKVNAELQDPAFHTLQEVTFNTTGLSVKLQGNIGADGLEKSTDMTFSVDGERLAAFQALAGGDITLPEQAFSIAGRVTATQGAWQLTDVSGNTGSTRFLVNGKLGYGESLAGSDFRLETSGTDLGRMFDIPGQARLPDGPFTAVSQLVLDDDRLRVSGTQASAGPFSLNLDADLPWPLDASQGRFSLHTAGVNITRILPELAGLELDAEDYEIIDEGDWQNGQVSIAKGQARIGDSTLSAQGKLDLPPNLSATDFQLEIHSPDLSRLGTIDGTRWGTVPLDLTSSFAGTTNRFLMEEFSARLGESNVTGDFIIDFEPEVPQFNLEFNTNALNLKPFQVAPVDREETGQEAEDPDGLLIPDIGFPMELLKRAEGNFAILAEQVFLKRMTLQNSGMTGEVRDGGLHIREIATDGYRGRLVSVLDLVPGADGIAHLSASMDAEQLIINLTQQSSQDKEVLPAFNIDIDLETSGVGLREAAGALSGTIRVNSPGGQVNNVSSESASTLFLSEVISAISPSAAKQETINISCIAATIDIRDGVVLLDPGIALQSDKLNIFAGGKVNLGTEKIDVSFRTETRKAVSLSASELVSPYVKLGGTLSSPSVALDAKGTLLSGGAAYLSGGLSILAKKALDQLGGTEDPCAEYLEETQTDQ
jgi:uncharacterized protein involved in outer membrane biogenesis